MKPVTSVCFIASECAHALTFRNVSQHDNIYEILRASSFQTTQLRTYIYWKKVSALTIRYAPTSMKCSCKIYTDTNTHTDARASPPHKLTDMQQV
jgi:hypothetical protein